MPCFGHGWRNSAKRLFKQPNPERMDFAVASVKQFRGSVNWYACYKQPTGQISAEGRLIFRRVQKSTGLTDRSRALQLAISFERAAELAAAKRWTERSARQFLGELSTLAGIEVAEIEATEAYARRWLAGKKALVAEKSWANFHGIINDFISFLGTNKSTPLLELTASKVAEFRDAELAAGKAATTVNKALSVLGQMFDQAVATQILPVNPARGLRVKGADKHAQKRQAFTFEQFRRLVHATAPDVKSARGNLLHPDWQTFIMVTGYTGARQQESAKLEWRNIDFSQHIIGLRRTKNSDVHWLPLHPALEKHLRLLLPAEGTSMPEGFVMPHIANLPERKISRYFRETILPRVGISQPYEAKATEGKRSVGRRLAQYSVHSLRHSLSTWLHGVGVSEMMRMRLIGHEDVGVSRRYTHSELQQAAAEMEKVPSV